MVYKPAAVLPCPLAAADLCAANTLPLMALLLLVLACVAGVVLKEDTCAPALGDCGMSNDDTAGMRMPAKPAFAAPTGAAGWNTAVWL